MLEGIDMPQTDGTIVEFYRTLAGRWAFARITPASRSEMRCWLATRVRISSADQPLKQRRWAVK